MSGESSRCWPCGAEDLTVCHWPLSGTKNELFLNVPFTDNREVDWLLGRGPDSAVFSKSFPPKGSLLPRPPPSPTATSLAPLTASIGPMDRWARVVNVDVLRGERARESSDEVSE